MSSNILFKLMILSLLLSLMACDATRTSRTKSTAGTTSDSLFNDGTETTSSGDIVVEETDGSSSDSVPTEIQHCTWSTDGSSNFTISSNHFSENEESTSENNVNLCQSQTSAAEVYVQMKYPVSDSQVCILPTYHSGSNQVYIGEPRCMMVTDNKKIYKVTLLINRVGFTHYPITGVIVMKDKSYFYDSPFYQYALSPDAYIYCSQWLAQYGDASYCVAFRDGGHYLYKEF